MEANRTYSKGYASRLKKELLLQEAAQLQEQLMLARTRISQLEAMNSGDVFRDGPTWRAKPYVQVLFGTFGVDVDKDGVLHIGSWPCYGLTVLETKQVKGDFAAMKVRSETGRLPS